MAEGWPELELISSGAVAPGTDVYLVAFAVGHKSLKLGDRVAMCETPKLENLWLRLNDLTLHELESSEFEYVLVTKE